MSPKTELRSAIRRQQLGVVVDWVAMDPPPRLTPQYEALLQQYKHMVQEVMSTADAILRSVTLADLKEQYGLDGKHDDESLKGVWRPLRERLGFVRDLNPIFLAGLGNLHYAADYGYWSRMEWMTLEETLWLCVGLDPRADWEKALRLNQSLPPREHRERSYMLAVREQLKRAAKYTSGSSIGFRGPELLQWITTTDFPAHPSFKGCLQKIARRNAAGSSTIPLPDSGNTDPREISSLARILTAIAIREYGYRPESKKSPIPGEIEAICDEEGLAVSRETILKYLRLGTKQRSADG